MLIEQCCFGMQVGEVVMYFPQGHAQYLHTFPENKTPPYKLFRGRPAVVRCQVGLVTEMLSGFFLKVRCLSFRECICWQASLLCG